MNATHFDQLFVLTAAGLGLFLAGGLNFALGGKGRRVWLRAVATVVICGAALAMLAYLTRTELALYAAVVLVPILLVGFLAGSDWFTRQLASLVTLLRRPGSRWLQVCFVGLVILMAAGVLFDLNDQAEIDGAMRDLELTTGRSPSRPVENDHAMTDCGNPIVLKEPTTPRDVNDLMLSEEKTLVDGKRVNLVIRRENATDFSNCHGWVFTGGKFLLGPGDVELILKDNGYSEIQDPRPGDLVIYRADGTITHSGVVRYVTAGQPVIVEGKWGAMGVFQHHAGSSCYGTNFTFYRSARQGHILVGVGGSPAARVANPSAAE